MPALGTGTCPDMVSPIHVVRSGAVQCDIPSLRVSQHVVDLLEPLRANISTQQGQLSAMVRVFFVWAGAHPTFNVTQQGQPILLSPTAPTLCNGVAELTRLLSPRPESRTLPPSTVTVTPQSHHSHTTVTVYPPTTPKSKALASPSDGQGLGI